MIYPFFHCTLLIIFTSCFHFYLFLIRQHIQMKLVKLSVHLSMDYSINFYIICSPSCALIPLVLEFGCITTSTKSTSLYCWYNPTFRIVSNSHLKLTYLYRCFLTNKSFITSTTIHTYKVFVINPFHINSTISLWITIIFPRHNPNQSYFPGSEFTRALQCMIKLSKIQFMGTMIPSIRNTLQFFMKSPLIISKLYNGIHKIAQKGFASLDVFALDYMSNST